MMRINRAVLGLAAASVFFSATPGFGQEAEGKLVFAKSGLTINSFEDDVDSCVTYVENQGASDEAKGAATAASFLLGGIFGAIAASSAYSASEERLMDECFLLRGYRFVSLPDSIDIGGSSGSTSYNSLEATRDLLDTNSVDEALAWQRAALRDRVAGYQTFLEKYPAGLLASDVRGRIEFLGGTAATASQTSTNQSVAALAPIDDSTSTNAASNQSAVSVPQPNVVEGGWTFRVVSAGTTTPIEPAPQMCAPGEVYELGVAVSDGPLEASGTSSEGADVSLAARMSPDSGGNNGEWRFDADFTAWGDNAPTFAIRENFSRSGFSGLYNVPVNGTSCLFEVSMSRLGAGPVGPTSSSGSESIQAVAYSSHPFDGAWQAVVNPTKVNTYSGGPDICYTSVSVPGIVVVQNGVLDFRIGEKNITSVNGTISTTGSAKGSLNSKGWNSQNLSFAENISATRLSIPYAMGNSCQGTLVLTKQGAVNPVVEPVQTASAEPSVLPVEAQPVAKNVHPFDGVWRATVNPENPVTYSGGPDICYQSVAVPRKIDVRNGQYSFTIGQNNVSIVEGTIDEFGAVEGSLDSRGWNSRSQQFSETARNGRIAIAYHAGKNCRGTLVLRRSGADTNTLASAAAQGADSSSDIARPIDGRWRVSVDLDRTRQQDRGPDLCNLSTELPATTTIKNSKLKIVFGSGVPTIFDGKLDNAGMLAGRISTAGYDGGVSNFNVAVKPTRIAIPFRIGASCDGTLSLRRSGSVASADTVSSLSTGSGLAKPYDGVWRMKTVMDQTRQRAYGPSLCILSTKKPEKSTIKNGKLYFTIDGGSPTIVEGTIDQDGQLTGEMNTRGYAGEVAEFTVQATTSKIVIPFRLGGSCRGSFHLSRNSVS